MSDSLRTCGIGALLASFLLAAVEDAPNTRLLDIMTLHVGRATGAVAARGEAERVEAIATRGFTERQARFLVTVMLHSGVFVGRQYAAFAGISHGQKVHDFIEKLLGRRFVTAIRLGLETAGVERESGANLNVLGASIAGKSQSL